MTPRQRCTRSSNRPLQRERVFENVNLRLSEPTLMGERVDHLRATGFVVLGGDHGRLEAPLNSVSERYDRARLHEALEEWQTGHPATTVELG